jgi:hypothetical protein
MNALSPIAVGLSLPADMAFDAWVSTGRNLANQRRNTDWMIADWLAHGQEHFADQIEFGFLSEALGLAPKRLKAVAQVATAFPAHKRDEGLSVDHHAHVATLPAAEQLQVLQQARKHNWTPEQTRIEAVRRKAVVEPPLIRDDPDYDALMAITTAWNRAPASVRADFLDLASESHMGVIDA